MTERAAYAGRNRKESSAVFLTYSPLLVWTAVAAFSIWLTWRWFAQSPTDRHQSSVIATSIAAFPGVLLLLQCFVRLGRERPLANLFDGWTLLSLIWVIVGPPLLVFGFLRKRRHPRPRGTAVVQLTHAALWAISSFVGCLFFGNAC